MPPLTQIYNDFRLARGERGRPLSHRAAAALAGDVNKYETFRLIGIGKHSGRISEDVVEALVRLGLAERDIRRAAGHQMESSPGPFQLPPRANRLTPPQRDVVVSVIDAILSAAEQQGRSAPPLRAVASGRRSPATAAQREAQDKAVRARREQGDS